MWSCVFAKVHYVKKVADGRKHLVGYYSYRFTLLCELDLISGPG